MDALAVQLGRDDLRGLAGRSLSSVLGFHAEVQQKLHRGMVGDGKIHVTPVWLKFLEEVPLVHLSAQNNL